MAVADTYLGHTRQQALTPVLSKNCRMSSVVSVLFAVVALEAQEVRGFGKVSGAKLQAQVSTSRLHTLSHRGTALCQSCLIHAVVPAVL